nr:globin family protein [Rhodoferax sp.]
MNSAEINLVQVTFDVVRPNALSVAEIFYKRLFTLDPSLRPLFKGDMVHQSRMLMAMLGAAVNGLTNLEALVPVVRQLGARHVNYGVQDEHYATVGSALIGTLDEGLGEKFTPAVREAWTAAYGLLSSVMLLGAIEARSAKEAANIQ